MTEEDAVKLWCPMTVRGGSAAKCIASKCALWVADPGKYEVTTTYAPPGALQQQVPPGPDWFAVAGSFRLVDGDHATTWKRRKAVGGHCGLINTGVH